jgi:hypothetical protein
VFGADTASASLSVGSSTIVATVPGGAGRWPSVPPAPGRTGSENAPRAGQVRSLSHTSGCRSIVACGSRMMPLFRSCNQ